MCGAAAAMPPVCARRRRPGSRPGQSGDRGSVPGSAKSFSVRDRGNADRAHAALDLDDFFEEPHRGAVRQNNRSRTSRASSILLLLLKPLCQQMSTIVARFLDLPAAPSAHACGDPPAGRRRRVDGVRHLGCAPHLQRMRSFSARSWRRPEPSSSMSAAAGNHQRERRVLPGVCRRRGVALMLVDAGTTLPEVLGLGEQFERSGDPVADVGDDRT